MLCQDEIAPENFYLSNVYANTNLKDWKIQLMYVYDQLLIIISLSGMLAMFGMGAGPSKLW